MTARGQTPAPKVAAELVQRAASDPAVSAAVRAAAGAGKTRLLVLRLLRLCLAGAEPQAIVALTYTRKAAVEIKARLLKELRALAALAPAERAARLSELLAAQPSPRQIELAGRLYDRFLEDLSGLSIGTIHAWCQRVLGRFAAELGLDPDFTVLEHTDELWAEALDRAERAAAADPAARRAWAGLDKTPDAARRALTRLFDDRLALDRWLERLARERGVAALGSDRAAFAPLLAADLRDALFAGTLLAGRDDPGPADIAPLLQSAARTLAAAATGAIPAVEPGAPTLALQKQLDALAASVAGAEDFARATSDAARAAIAARLRALLLTSEGGLRVLNGKMATKQERQALFAAAARPLLQALALLDLVGLWQRNVARLETGLRALDIYEALKRRDRAVDFHDLERLTRHLVAESELAPYVQYRLDAAVAHLLVDEFQDTNHNQWDILRPLVEEFLAGEGAAAAPRTLLVVGDAKQSIYRFRGAEPELFDHVEARLRAHAQASGEGGGRVVIDTLPTNFRSVPAIVESVGRLFGAPPLRDRLPPGEAGRVAQAPARDAGPSNEVLVVPPYAPDETEGAVGRAARAAAALVARWLAQASVPDDTADKPAVRALTPGDVLVLSRARTRIGPYEEALRREGVRVAPSGRGALARSREVQDILQLLRWLAFPDDDVALASVLRSPLLRVSEAQLQRALAARRRQRDGRLLHISLWSVLRRELKAGLAGQPTDLTDAARRLTAWRRHAGFEPCHELLRRIYRDADALERFALARGEQARWNLLRLHDLALQMESGPGPSLRRFAALIAREARCPRGADEAAVPEHGEGRVGVMTVHGAKGLEAPAVLLVDAAAPMSRVRGRLPLVAAGPDCPIAYDVPKSLVEGPTLPPGVEPVAAPALARAVAAACAAQANEEADLLYVACTRARDLLGVVGSHVHQTKDRPHFLGWLDEAAANAQAADPAPLPLSLGEPPWLEEALAAPGADAALPAPGGATTPDDVIAWDPPPTHARVRLLSPSTLLATGEGADDGDQDGARVDVAGDAVLERGAPARAAARGEAIHLWLRLAGEPGGLPDDPAAALGPQASGWTADALAEARAVAANPRLAPLFRPEAAGRRGLSEVPILHRVAGGASGAADGVETRVYGVIDRLLIGDDTVEIIDYKSNGIATDEQARRLAERYRPQLAAYRDAIAALFPGRNVRAHLLFTHLRDEAGGQGRLYEI